MSNQEMDARPHDTQVRDEFQSRIKSLQSRLEVYERVLGMSAEELAKERWLEMVKGIDNHCLWEHENEKFKKEQIVLAELFLSAINRLVTEGLKKEG